MSARAKRKREKQRNDNRRHLLAAAQMTYENNPAPYPHRFFDGQLVHEMTKDKRSFDYKPGFGSGRVWVTLDVFATKCGRVVAVSEPRFSFSKRTTSCIGCLSLPKPRFTSFEEYVEQFRTSPWTG